MKIVTLHYFIFSVLNNRPVTYPNDIMAGFILSHLQLGS